MPFRRHFHEIWYSNQWFVRDKGAQNINWVYFEQIIVKSTQFYTKYGLSIKNGILMGEYLGKKLVQRKSKFSRSCRHPRTILANVTPRAQVIKWLSESKSKHESKSTLCMLLTNHMAAFILMCGQTLNFCVLLSLGYQTHKYIFT